MSRRINSFQDLQVWQKAHRMILRIYAVSGNFPNSERFGMVTQIRRAAVSIAANLVEGGKRRSLRDYAHFVNISEGSLEETKYLLLLGRDLKYISLQDYESLAGMAAEVGRMLHGLRSSLCRS